MTESITYNGRQFRDVNAGRASPRIATPVPSKKRSKYGARSVVIDGITFDSQREGRRWIALRELQRVGWIRDLERQVVYVLAPAVHLRGEKRKKPALRYIADFRYFDLHLIRQVVEDTKGRDTPVSRIKRHLMKSVHGIDVILS